jgi:hypothetical protein
MNDLSFKPKNNILNSYLALSRFYSTHETYIRDFVVDPEYVKYFYDEGKEKSKS